MAVIRIEQLPLADIANIDDTAKFPAADSLDQSVHVTLAMLREALGVLTLAGMVTASGDPFGTIAVTINNGVVTLAMFDDIPTGKLLGRSTAGDGPPELLDVGPGLLLSGGTLDTAAAQSASDASTLHDHRAFGGF